MKLTKLFFLLILIPLLSFTTMHKYYVSVTEIDYVKEKQSVQITSRIFIDDLENLLRERYDEDITLDQKSDEKVVDDYISKYLTRKIIISINDEIKPFLFIGKEYEDNIVYCYLEISDVENIDTFEVTNRVLFDLYSDQKNIVKTNINSKKKSFLLISQNDKGVLNFN